MSESIIVIDTETTGFQPFDRIVSLAALRCSLSDDDCDGIYLCFDPRKDSHPEAIKVHGWDNWTTRFQDLFSDHAEALRRWFDGATVVVAHNAAFDLQFLNREFRKAEQPILDIPAFCTLEQARAEWPGQPAKLDICVERIGMQRQGDRHHPMEDAYFAWNLYRHFHGRPILRPQDPWPHPTNFRAPSPPPEGELPRRIAKRSSTPGRRWTPTEHASVMALARPVAALLVFLALADNHFADQEKAVIHDLVVASAARLGLSPFQSDVEHIVARLLDLEPSRNLVTRAMKSVLADDEWRARLPKLMTSMVAADGRFVEDERAALQLVKDALLRQLPMEDEH